MVTYVRGAGEGIGPEVMEELREIELALQISDWYDFTMQNSWTGGVSGYAEPGYSSDGGERVYLRGSTGGGTKTAGTTICTLPEELWPMHELVFPLPYRDSSVPAHGELHITAGGALQIYGVSGIAPILSLDGVIFRVGQ